MRARTKVARARPVLTRDSIADAALRVMLEEPTTTLTLARLGAELGADPTALYRHYRSREELITDLGDRVFVGPNDRFRHRDDWRESLTAFALDIRAAFLMRPALAAEIGSRFTGGPHERRSMEILQEVMASAGLPDDRAMTQVRAVGSMVVSHAVMTAMLMSMPTAALELDAAIARGIHGDDAGDDSREFEDASFRIILDTYIVGLATLTAVSGASR